MMQAVPLHARRGQPFPLPSAHDGDVAVRQVQQEEVTEGGWCIAMMKTGVPAHRAADKVRLALASDRESSPALLQDRRVRPKGRLVRKIVGEMHPKRRRHVVLCGHAQAEQAGVVPRVGNKKLIHVRIGHVFIVIKQAVAEVRDELATCLLIQRRTGKADKVGTAKV